MSNNFMIELMGKLLIREKGINELGEEAMLIKKELPMRILIDVNEISDLHEELDDDNKLKSISLNLKNGKSYWCQIQYDKAKELIEKYRNIVSADEISMN